MTATTSDLVTEQTEHASLMTITEVADRLNVTVRQVRRLVQDRRIPYIKWGHLLRFDPDEIEAWITGHQVGAQRPSVR